ncbi:hypothetical protein C1924_15595 [Stenotrophomonas sp. ESTM1D_MKCIP4_1]|uniref:GtrA family protein n=1 Tax=Stenotrophomonas sp. ESTM1D_MKCIP4_1 TaxID=2072414 RepID=UPI000D54184D|nr:GtrA family protein [Stenotrophomonas sp. ESTM1D_MKCIP4_1]AWH54500.1 hypothetical protein C1924_15595 [Stenotrophomonas sp. ESTM1D_MKCIP4_1]
MKSVLRAARLKLPRGVVGEGVAYLCASVLALVVDFSVFLLLSSFGLHWASSAAGGFISGSVVAYLVSIKYVFSQRSMESRCAELLAFVSIGGVGLLVVQGVMLVSVNGLGVSALVARLIAVLFSFFSNFALRKLIVFRARERDRSQGLGEGEGEVA